MAADVNPGLAPLELKQVSGAMLGIVWNDGHHSLYKVRNLRLACRCAFCVDEWTQEPRLDEATVGQDVRPNRIEPVGRYAFKFFWTDGHDAGIYPFASLRKLCECHACKSA